MAQTANLGLPLIDANMTADVPRDMNALANAVDTAVTEAVAGVTVPDATTTQKGVVQLNDTTTSTNKTQAGTADAVRRAYDRGSEGVTAAATAQAKADAAETPAGAQAKANTAETNAKNYANTGFIKKAILLPDNTDMNDLRDEGEYYCPANYSVGTFKNTPDQYNQACYVKVSKHAGVNQTWYVFNPSDNRIFTRNYYAETGWGPWLKILNQSDYDTLFTSVANGKQAIATAISGKGIAASGSDEFAVLANKISQINTGKKYAKGQVSISGGGSGSVGGLAFMPRNVIMTSAGTASSYFLAVYTEDSLYRGAIFNRILGVANTAQTEGVITPSINGFSVNNLNGDMIQTYNYYATE